MNYFITGAGGFIGRKLTNTLAAEGNFVYALLYSEKELLDFPTGENIVPIIGDLNSYQEILEKVKGNNIDCVFHLGLAGISTADYKNIDIQKKNLEMSINATELAKAFSADKFIFVGTNQEYVMGTNTLDGSEINASVYGVCKLCARLLCQTLCKNKIKFNATAFTNVYGAGDFSKRTANLFIHKLQNGEALDLITGEHLYDWIYIDDAVRGLIAVSQKGVSGKQYYIGSRELRTFREIITELRDILNPNVMLNFGKYADTTYTNYDAFSMNELYEDTGFECSVSFKDGVRKTAEWVKQMNWGE